MHKSITRGRRLLGQQLIVLEVRVGEFADTIRNGTGKPTKNEIRQVVRDFHSEATDRIHTALADVGDTTANGFIEARMEAHTADALASVKRMMAAAEANGVDEDQLRADFAALMNGETIDFSLYDIPATFFSGLKTLGTDATRLLVNEGNEAIRRVGLSEMLAEGFTRAPWELSPAHPAPDVCDDIAADGPYPLDDWPVTPHVYCGCMPGDPLE